MTKQEFIVKIAPMAQEDMRKSAILASVTIAQACLESAYGSSELAESANNLFGMKCSLSGNTWTSTWDGVSKYTKQTQEQRNGEEFTITADFRKYPSWVTSVCDHSLYLTQAKTGGTLRYAGLVGEKNYRKAVEIIKSGGYATDAKYVDKVCTVIETWNLTKYDGGRTVKICLDAGHYGKYNQSPCNEKYYESDMVWKLHLLQKKYLEEYGAEVVLTRKNQENDLTLYTRGAESAGCNLFISDHSNAADSKTVDYPVAYCTINGRADAIGNKLAKCIEDVMQTRQLSRIEHRTGKNGDYYGVLRGAAAVGTPGLILEHSFHTNPEATAWLMDADNLDKLARAEVDVIASHFGLSKREKIGWVNEDGGERFYLDGSKYVINDWYEYEGDWYWFDGAGHMVTNVWYYYKDSWYYLGEDGAMVKGQQTIDEKWYIMDSDGKLLVQPVVLTPDRDGVLMYSGLVE